MESVTMSEYLGVLIQKCSGLAMERAIRKHELSPKKDLTVKEQIKVISEYVQAAAKDGEHLVTCDECRGDSTNQFDACPYCGDGAELEAVASDADAGAEVEPVEEVEAVQAVAQVVAKPKASKKNGVNGTNGHANGHGNGHQLAIIPEATTAVPVKLVREKDLDEAVARIHVIKANVAANAWELGQEILKVFQSEVWKQRTGADGKPLYKAFDAFVKNELHITAVHAQNLMDVSARFSPSDVREFGASKLTLLLKAPEIEQERIYREKIKANASTREVAAEVKKTRAKHGAGGTKPVKRKVSHDMTTAHKAAVKANTKTDKITVASLMGRQRVHLFTPATYKLAPKDRVKVKRVADEPCGILELVNDVQMHFSVVQDNAGHLVLIVNTLRVEE